MITMKNFIYIILIIFVASCQRVIHIDLNSANPQYVVEAKLFEGTNDFTVRITKSSDYFDTITPPPVNNAIVIIANSSGNNQTAAFVGDGWYRIANYNAPNNVTYNLTITVDGKVFNASAYLPSHISIDSIMVDSLPGGGPGPGGPGKGPRISLKCIFTDPAGVKNYYKLSYIANGSNPNSQRKYDIFDDKTIDGLQTKNNLRGRFNKGDTVEVELQSIDAKVYDYFNTVNAIASRDINNNASPANPNSNITGGCLGYFGVFTSDKKVVVIQ